MVRRALDALYLASGYLAAVFLFLIAATIVAQVLGRLWGITVDSTESGGFSLAAMTFFGLAYTLKSGGHIRINLALRHLSPPWRWGFELWCTGVGAVAMGYFSYQSALLNYESWFYNDLSPGLLAFPFWIPQLAMTAGIALFTLALADEFFCILAGKRPSYEVDDPATDLHVGRDEGGTGRWTV